MPYGNGNKNIARGGVRTTKKGKTNCSTTELPRQLIVYRVVDINVLQCGGLCTR